MCFAAEMKYDVEIFFIFFFVNSAAIPTFASSKCGSHQQFTLCIWWTVVLTLHSREWRKQKRHPSEDVCNVVKSEMKKD